MEKKSTKSASLSLVGKPKKALIPTQEEDRDNQTFVADGMYWDPIGWSMPKSWTIIDQVRKRPPLGWIDLFKRCDNILQEISTDHEGFKWFPDAEDLFAAFHLTPLDKVKVVIIGQDPYFTVSTKTGKPVACGVAFGVRPGEPVAASLNNIYIQLENEYPGWKKPSHGCLTYWALQGVLLINTDLTVKPGTAGSLKNWWWPFISEVIKTIRKQRSKAVWMLWGKHAQNAAEETNMDKNYVLTSSHPSPNSAHISFFGSSIFKDCNSILTGRAKTTEIDWLLPDITSTPYKEPKMSSIVSNIHVPIPTKSPDDTLKCNVSQPATEEDD